MLVTKQKFQQYQNAFYKKLQATPHKIDLEIVTVQTEEPTKEFSMEAFVGDSKRESKFYSLRALYEKEVPGRTREKYGLADTVNGVVYLSPKQLKPILGDYHVNQNTTKIHFCGSTQVIDKVIYLEEFKEYNDCIAVQIFLKDDLKGG